MENRPPKITRKLHLNPIFIGETPYGKGVFASRSIPARTPIGRILGEIKPPGYRSDYCMSFRDGAIEPEDPYRLVNHSCDPNSELIEWEITNPENGEKIYELWIHSVRRIEKGEQITIDYAWDAKAAIPCLCGSPLCRGWICKKEELEICIQERERESLE
ncbi:MAG: SET domain-containing protein-lysine N-methyltransferase [Planctomycetia bacterium]|nr:SET domain-containing protein-lysine N-methyltransferase [Planctomycetia bacterium]